MADSKLPPNTKFVDYEGKVYSIAGLARHLKKSPTWVKARLDSGEFKYAEGTREVLEGLASEAKHKVEEMAETAEVILGVAELVAPDNSKEMIKEAKEGLERLDEAEEFIDKVADDVKEIGDLIEDRFDERKKEFREKNLRGPFIVLVMSILGAMSYFYWF